MFCPKCGNELPDTTRFCAQCGSTLRTDEVQQQQESDASSPRGAQQPKAEGGHSAKNGKPNLVAIAGGIAAVAVIAILAFAGLGKGPQESVDVPQADSVEQQEGNVGVLDNAYEAPKTAVDFGWGIDTVMQQYPYEDFIAPLVMQYPELSEEQIKGIATQDAYREIVNLSGMMLSLQAEKEHGEFYNTVTAMLKERNESLVSELQAAAEGGEKQYAIFENMEYDYDPDNEWYVVTGTLANRSNLNVKKVQLFILAEAYYQPYDKYGDKMELEGGENQLTQTVKLYASEGMDIGRVSEGIVVYDLAPGEEREVTAYVQVRFEDVYAAPKGQDPDCWVDNLSYGIDYVDFYDSALGSESVADVSLEPNVQLDPNERDYRAHNGQLGVVVDHLDIEGEREVELFFTVTNNTGFYISDEHIDAELYGELLDDASLGEMRIMSARDDWSVPLKPGESSSFVVEAVMAEGLTWESTRGEYTFEEFEREHKYRCVFPSISYKLDIEKNIEQGLLPDDWETRSKKYERDQRAKEYLTGVLQASLNSFEKWCNENPEEALQLGIDIAEAGLGIAIDMCVDEILATP